MSILRKSKSWRKQELASVPQKMFLSFQDSSIRRFASMNPIVGCSNSLSTKLSLRVLRAATSLWFQAYKSWGLVTSVGKAWTLLDMRIYFQCPKIYHRMPSRSGKNVLSQDAIERCSPSLFWVCDSTLLYSSEEEIDRCRIASHTRFHFGCVKHNWNRQCLV